MASVAVVSPNLGQRCVCGTRSQIPREPDCRRASWFLMRRLGCEVTENGRRYSSPMIRRSYSTIPTMQSDEVIWHLPFAVFQQPLLASWLVPPGHGYIP